MIFKIDDGTAHPVVPAQMTETMTMTASRVSAQTSDEINRRLRWQMEERLAYYETHTNQIAARLAELDREWDVERTLERMLLPGTHGSVI